VAAVDTVDTEEKFRGGLRLAVFQPTSLCNLDCSYCYVPDRQVKGLMSEDVVEAAAKFVFSIAPRQPKYRLLWHAGEPLMAGISFYRRAFDIIESVAPRGSRIEHAIQTNGMLVTDEWCELFTSRGVKVGLSIDGPAEIHDASRKSWSGRGSHDRVMRGYHTLRKHGINPGALCVLTNESLQQPDLLYDFFRDAGFESVAFNVEETEGANSGSSLALAAPERLASDYRRFIERIWRRWRADDSRLEIREFERELLCVADLQRDPGFVREPDEVVPFGIVTIRKDGRVGTFSPELASTTSSAYADFALGNVLTDSPDDVHGTEAFRRLADDVQRGREACRQSCSYFSMCGAGFQSNRVAEHGSLLATETTTCRIHRQTLTDVVLAELTDESRELASSLSTA
jgi:uncharacterized protein